MTVWPERGQGEWERTKLCAHRCSGSARCVIPSKSSDPCVGSAANLAIALVLIVRPRPIECGCAVGKRRQNCGSLLPPLSDGQTGNRGQRHIASRQWSAT